MTEQTTTAVPSVRNPLRRVSRREALQSMAGMAVAAAGSSLLGACSGPSPSSERDGGSGNNEPVRVWMVAESPADRKFQKEQFARLEKENKGLKVEVQFFPTDQFANAMQLAFTSGRNVPDVFKAHGAQKLNLLDVHRRGWVSPLDEFITDEFKARFPAYVFDPAASSLFIDGQVWGIPLPDPDVYSTRIQLSNLDLLNKHGFDAPPETWTSLREMSAKITRDANRKAYGTALSGITIRPSLAIIQNLAGPQPYRQEGQPPISLLTGMPALSEGSELAMVRFFQQMHKDNLLAPGWQSWKGDTLLQQMAGGRLATYTWPIFHAEVLRKANPDLNLAVTMPPVPDAGQQGTRNTQASLATYMMSSKANKEKAWKVLDLIGSLEYERAAFQATGTVGIMPELFEGIEVDPDTKAIREIAGRTVRNHPRPEVRNPDAEVVYNEVAAKGPKPGPDELWMQAITRGEDFEKLANNYDAELLKVLTKQFAEAKSKGMDVSSESYAFPDWDPMTDYVTKK